jgi:hypothetical protein
MLNFKTNYRIELAPTLSGHWYQVFAGDKDLGYFPSVTTILNAYPQSQHLTRWIADQGWNESQRIKSEAGERGTNVHQAIEHLLAGQNLNRLGSSLEEWWKISTFVDWYHDFKPEVLATEIALFSKKYKFAGRVDCIAKINGKITVIDWKTSGSIYDHYPLQFASYAQAVEENTDLKVEQTAVVQMGTKSKKGYKFEEYSDWKKHLKVFAHVQKTWKYDYFDSRKNPKEPPVLILPESLKL